MLRFYTFIFCFGLATITSWAQPNTDIFVFSLHFNNETIALKDGKNVTQREGYDNQPYFFSDTQLYYTAQQNDGQTDIFRVKVPQGKPKAVTQTAESEYSPTPVPNEKALSVIQVEADGTQRLWKFPLKGKKTPSVVLPTLQPVGYHIWTAPTQLALFVLGEPNTLQVASTTDEAAETLLGNVGRCFQHIPNSEQISFVHKVDSTQWMIKSLDTQTGTIEEITATLPEVEDYVWLNNQTLLMGKGSKLYLFTVGQSVTWTEVGDLSSFGIYAFDRMAVSPNRLFLAVVASDFDE